MENLIPSNGFSDESDIRNIRVGAVKTGEQHRLNNAVRYRQCMNDEQHALFQSCFENAYVLPDNNVVPKTSSHPVMAALNDYSNMRAQGYINGYRRQNLKVISIGDSATRNRRTDHNCLLLDDSRDLMRVSQTDSADQNLLDYARNRTKHTHYCTNGTQNCNFQAEAAVAVHSIYNMTPQEIFHAFEAHNLNKLHAWIYIPFAIYNKDYIAADIIASRLQFDDQDDDVVYFTLNDFNAGYKHSVKKWKLWAEITKINGYENREIYHMKNSKSSWVTEVEYFKDYTFSIAVERIQRNGPLVEFLFSRIKYVPDYIPSNIPLGQGMSEYVLVPNMRLVALNNFSFKNTTIPRILVPAFIVNGTLNYAMRVKDDAYKFTEVAAYMTGQSTKVIINSKIIRKKWEVPQKTYNDTLLSLFIIGAIRRRVRTQMVSSTFKELGSRPNEYSHDGIIQELANFFSEKYYSIGAWAHRLFHAFNNDKNDFFFRIEKFDVVPISDYVSKLVCDVVSCFVPPVLPLTPQVPYGQPPVAPTTGSNSNNRSQDAPRALPQPKPRLLKKSYTNIIAPGTLQSSTTLPNTITVPESNWETPPVIGGLQPAPSAPQATTTQVKPETNWVIPPVMPPASGGPSAPINVNPATTTETNDLNLLIDMSVPKSDSTPVLKPDQPTSEDRALLELMHKILDDVEENIHIESEVKELMDDMLDKVACPLNDDELPVENDNSSSPTTRSSSFSELSEDVDFQANESETKRIRALAVLYEAREKPLNPVIPSQTFLHDYNWLPPLELIEEESSTDDEDQANNTIKNNPVAKRDTTTSNSQPSLLSKIISKVFTSEPKQENFSINSDQPVYIEQEELKDSVPPRVTLKQAKKMLEEAISLKADIKFFSYHVQNCADNLSDLEDTIEYHSKHKNNSEIIKIYNDIYKIYEGYILSDYNCIDVSAIPRTTPEDIIDSIDEKFPGIRLAVQNRLYQTDHLCAVNAIFEASSDAFGDVFSDGDIGVLAYYVLCDSTNKSAIATAYFIGADISYSFSVIERLSTLLELNIYVQSNEPINSKDAIIRINTNIETDPQIILHMNDHYTYDGFMTIKGGKKDKFPPLVAAIANRRYDYILETAAAPGYLLSEIIKCGKFNRSYITAMIYTGPKSLKLDANFPIDECELQYYSGNINTASCISYIKNQDLIIIDAGREHNTEEITEQHLKFAMTKLNIGGDILVKTFSSPHYLFALGPHFENISIIERFDENNYVSSGGSERYFICQKRLPKPTGKSFHHYYDLYNKIETEHIAILRVSEVNRFYDKLFEDPNFEKFKFTRNCNRDKTIRVLFSAITGFASASKTTNAIKKYPHAVFISPTRYLATNIQSRNVRAFTPHAAFSKITDGDHIIVDECSQFCVEYVALLQEKFPSSKVTILGDIYQTQMFLPSNVEPFTSFRDVGVRNNIIDVYTIPRDITSKINRLFNWNLRTHSEVERSVYKLDRKLLPDLLLFKHIPFLCVNEKTAKELCSKGVDAHTITTYTGSRSNNIILIIDGAALESKYINKPSIHYTAVTRAKQRLFIVEDDTNSLTKLYNFDHTLIDCIADFSDLVFCDQSDEVKNEKPWKVTDIEVDIPLRSIQTVVEAIPTSSLLASTICAEKVVKFHEEPENMTIITQTIGDKEKTPCSTLITTEDQLNAAPLEIEVTKISNVNNIVNQSSRNVFETIQTLMTRYAYRPKRVRNGRKPRDFCYTQLVKGILRSIYGQNTGEFRIGKFRNDMLISHEELRQNAFDYVESLDTKLGAAIYTTDDINTILDEYSLYVRDARLSFFNKSQSKHKTSDFFDTKFKAGQGVASFSKKINLIYGAYARAILDRIKALYKKYNPKIVLLTHGSDDENMEAIRVIIEEIVQNGNYRKWTCNDFSEWDSSFRAAFARFTHLLCTCAGMPVGAADWFLEHRDNWEMNYLNHLGTTILQGKEKQFSGNPFTICENTLGNIALCFALFKFVSLELGLFKGDDSGVNCERAEPRSAYKDILAYTGHGLKLHNMSYGEFAGYFIHAEGIFPDVFRYATKFLAKPYRDEEHFSEAVMSTIDRVSTVKTQIELTYGCHIAADYYTRHMHETTPEEVYTLFDFLRTAQNYSYKQFEGSQSVLRYMYVSEKLSASTIRTDASSDFF
jgi:hypothetical protein